MVGAGRDSVAPGVRRLRVALIVAVVVAAVLGLVAIRFYLDLTSISACDGGLAPGGPSCSGPAFLAEQQGHSHFVNGTYVCSVLVYPEFVSNLISSSLSVSAENVSGANVALLSVTLYWANGAPAANYSLSGGNWTTNQSEVFSEPQILTATSSTSLVGQFLGITDTTRHYPVLVLIS
jgi:hypothetical protein